MINQVFISYRQESPEHGQAVRRLGELLRQAGLPVALDQFLIEDQPGGPDQGWPKWCEDCAGGSAAVLVIASVGWFAAYDGTAPRGTGRGSAAEAGQFRQYLYDAAGHNPRIRLVFIDAFDPDLVPERLRAWHRFQPFASAADLDQLLRWAAQRVTLAGREPDSAAHPPPAANPADPATPGPARDPARDPGGNQPPWERQRQPLRDLLTALPAWSLVRDRKAFVESALDDHPAARGLIWDDDPFTVAANLVQRLQFFDAVPLSDGRHAVCGLLAQVRARGLDQQPGIRDQARGLAAAFGCALGRDPDRDPH